MKRAIPLVLLAAILTLPALSARAATAELKLSVKVPAAEGKDVPVCAKIDLPAALKGVAPEKIGVSMQCGGQTLPGQVALRDGQAELWWVLPEATPGASQWTAALSEKPYAGQDVFAFEDAPGKHMDLRFAGRLVTRYLYEFDRSTKEKAFETYKPFLHVFDAAGKDVITKDAHGHDPHHRGVFLGWGKVTCGGKSYDFWSMGRGEAQVHRKFVDRTAGPVLARCADLLEWVDKDGKVILSERRETTCFRQSAEASIVLMEYRSTLEAVAGDATLEANAEHGGFQWRSHNEVAVNVGATGGKQTADKAPEQLKTQYEFHREGIKTAGQSLKDNKDLPWAAQCFALRGKRYSVQHMNHPSDPKGTVYSAYRQYGRFGAFFKTTVKTGTPLPLLYRIYAAESTMPPREEMNARHAAFVTAPVATVVP